MLGGLYIEMAMCPVLGYWLDGSGWTRALLEAGIVTSGRADSFLKALPRHIMHTRLQNPWSHARDMTSTLMVLMTPVSPLMSSVQNHSHRNHISSTGT